MIATVKTIIKAQMNKLIAVSIVFSFFTCFFVFNSILGCFEGGVAAANNRAKIAPTSKKGSQKIPRMEGPMGVIHKPPAQVARKIIRKKM